MANSKQSAGKSTGGSDGRKQLARASAGGSELPKRLTHRKRAHPSRPKLPPDTPMDFIMCKGGDEFVLKLENVQYRTVEASEVLDFVDPLVLQFCLDNEKYKVTRKSAVWWGLLDRMNEEGTSARSDYTVRFVKFDPEMGVESEPVKGGFLGKESDRTPAFPIRLYTLGGLDQGFEASKQLRKLYDTCTKDRPGQWVEVGPLGSRRAADAEAMEPYILDREALLPYQSTEVDGCVPAAAANAVQPYDSEAAQKMSACDPDVESLAEFAKYVQDEVRTWTAENPLKRLAKDTSKTYMGVKEKLQWALQQEDGIFLIQPIIKHGGNSHVIAIDCGKKVIYDPMEQHALRLQAEVMGLCAGGDVNECIGIGQIRQLKPQADPQVPKKRRRIRRGRGGKGKQVSRPLVQ